MKLARTIFTITLTAMGSPAYAICQIGDIRNCTLNGRQGVEECDPTTHMMTPCQVQLPSCPSPTGALFPKYYVLGLVYSPPGCTSTSSLKCTSAASSVDYQSGSSMGTKVATSSSFSEGVSVAVDASFGVDNVGKFGASVSGGYSNTSSDSSSKRSQRVNRSISRRQAIRTVLTTIRIPLLFC